MKESTFKIVVAAGLALAAQWSAMHERAVAQQYPERPVVVIFNTAPAGDYKSAITGIYASQAPSPAAGPNLIPNIMIEGGSTASVLLTPGICRWSITIVFITGEREFAEADACTMGNPSQFIRAGTMKYPPRK